jgi:hypothetical protein
MPHALGLIPTATPLSRTEKCGLGLGLMLVQGVAQKASPRFVVCINARQIA